MNSGSPPAWLAPEPSIVLAAPPCQLEGRTRNIDEVAGEAAANPGRPEGRLRPLQPRSDARRVEHSVQSPAFAENVGNRNLKQNNRGLA